MAEGIKTDEQLHALVEQLAESPIYIRHARRRGLNEGRPRDEIVAEASSATLSAYAGRGGEHRHIEAFFRRQIDGTSDDGYIKTEAQLDRLLQTFVRDGRAWVTDPRDRDEPDLVLDDAYEKVLRQLKTKLDRGITPKNLESMFRRHLVWSGADLGRAERDYMRVDCPQCSSTSAMTCFMCDGHGMILVPRVTVAGIGQEAADDDERAERLPLDRPDDAGDGDLEDQQDQERLIDRQRAALHAHVRAVRIGLLDLKGVRVDRLVRHAVLIETAAELEADQLADVGESRKAAAFGGHGPRSTDRNTMELALLDSVALVYDPPSADTVENSRTKTLGRWIEELHLGELQGGANS